MRSAIITAAIVGAVLCTAPLDAQRRTTTRKPSAPPAPPRKEAAQIVCPEQLGVGVKTRATFCFVLARRDPAEGVLVTIPPHTGPATLTFDLHNRHTYSEEEVKAGRGFARYSAVVAALSMSGDLLGRGAVQTEFRNVRDLYDRITGGAGPGGMKAVAPLGREQVTITIPAGVDQISLLGEVLEATTSAGREIATPGRPVAVISNPQIEYRPGPAKKPPARR